MKNATLLLATILVLFMLQSSCQKTEDCPVQITIDNITPSSNPAGFEVVLQGANLSANTTIRFGNSIAATRFSDEVGLIATIPNGLNGIVEVTAEENNCIARKDFEVLTEFPAGTPINPTTIVIPSGITPSLPGSIGNRWFNVYDPDHVLCIIDDSTVGGQGENIRSESQECHGDDSGLTGSINGSGSVIYNNITLTIDRYGAKETFDGQFIDPALVDSPRDFALLLTSRKTDRQLALHAYDENWATCPEICD